MINEAEMIFVLETPRGQHCKCWAARSKRAFLLAAKDAFTALQGLDAKAALALLGEAIDSRDAVENGQACFELAEKAGWKKPVADDFETAVFLLRQTGAAIVFAGKAAAVKALYDAATWSALGVRGERARTAWRKLIAENSAARPRQRRKRAFKQKRGKDCAR